MKNHLITISITSVICGLYCIGISYFFNPFELIVSEKINFIYFELFLISTVCSFLLTSVALVKSNKLLFQVNFALSLLIVGLISWLHLYETYDSFIYYIGAFFIGSIPITAIAFVWNPVKIQLNKGGLNENQNKEGISKQFKFVNSTGKLKLNIPYENIICFEANDNYTNTYHFTNKNEISKSVNRVSLKALEKIIDQDEIDFKRVHKSYIVNPNFIKKIKGSSQSHKLELEHLDQEIPVSRGFNIDQLK